MKFELVGGMVAFASLLATAQAENQVPYIGMPCSNNLDCGVSITLMHCGSSSGGFTCNCQQFLAAVKYTVTKPNFDTNANKCVVKKWDTCKLGRDGSVPIPCEHSSVCAVNKDETDVGTCVNGAEATTTRLLPISILVALLTFKVFSHSTFFSMV